MADYDRRLPLHVGDYLSDTMDLTTLQHGIYIRLIMHYWKRHEALPADDRVLAQIAGLSRQAFRRVSGPVMALFTLTEDWQLPDKGKDLTAQKVVRESRFSHHRLEDEISRARELSAKRKAAGNKGLSSRYGWQLPGDEASNCASPAREERARREPLSPCTQEKPPHSPPANGGAGGDGLNEQPPANAFRTPQPPTLFRNGFIASAAADMEQQHDQAADPHPSGARVVAIPRRPHRD